MEIWDIIGECGMVESEIYQEGQEAMMPYYGQDFGGQEDQEDQEDEAEGEEQGDARQVPSEEYIYDSG
jgi:hypothetical protein